MDTRGVSIVLTIARAVVDTVDEADIWMATYGPVGSGIRGNSEAWQTGESLYLFLDDYNNGYLCAPPRN